MIYEYRCMKCDTAFDVIKSVKDIDRTEFCNSCGDEGIRQFAPKKLYLSGTKVQEAEYNPAFGKVIKNKNHLKNELSRIEHETGNKMVEVGNDFGSGEKMQKKFDQERAEKFSKRWEND